MSLSPTVPSPMAGLPSRIRFLGYPVDAIRTEDAVAIVEESIHSRRTCTHASLNASTVVAMRHDPSLVVAIANADIITADGQSVVWGARLLGSRIPERVPATDLM